MLSRSDRHKIGLARALYGEPKVLIIDEPDAGLRDRLATPGNGVVRSMKERDGVLIVLTSAPSEPPFADARAVLDQGRLKNLVTFDNVAKIKPPKADKPKALANQG